MQKNSYSEIFLSCCLLIFVGWLTYVNSLNNPFIFDDLRVAVDNPKIEQLWPIWNMFVWPDNCAISGRPLVNLSLAINYALGGSDVWGYHVFNLILHILCSLILFGVIRRTLQTENIPENIQKSALPLALSSSLLWLTHPIQTECINYIIQRTEIMMAMFYLLTFYCSIRSQNSCYSKYWKTMAVIFCICGMGSKEVMVTAPFMLVLYDLIFSPLSWRKLLKERGQFYICLASTWFLLAALMLEGPRAASVGFSGGITPLEYAMNQCVFVIHYFRLVFFPYPLVLDYGGTVPITWGETIPSGILLLTLLALVSRTLYTHPKIGFLGAWVFVILSPSSSFVPIITEVAAERRMYLPLAAIIVLFVLLSYSSLFWIKDKFLSEENREKFNIRLVSVFFVTVIVGLMSWASITRNFDYSTSEKIWLSSVKAYPENKRAKNNLGVIYADLGEYEKAILYYKQALKLNPKYYLARENLGVAYLKQKKAQKALTIFKMLIAERGKSPNLLTLCGMAQFELGFLDDAIDSYQKAVRAGYWKARYHLKKAIQKKKSLE